MNSTVTKAQEAIFLKKSEPAPFSGSLITIEDLRDLEKQAEKADFYKTQMEHNKDCLPELSGFEPTTSSESFLIGAGVALTLSAILVIVFKK